MDESFASSHNSFSKDSPSLDINSPQEMLNGRVFLPKVRCSQPIGCD